MPVGGRWSRFSSFLYGPGAMLRYVAGRADPLHRVGHNPLGGWSVAAMLLALMVQVGLGLFSVDQDGFESGPLAKYVKVGPL